MPPQPLEPASAIGSQEDSDNRSRANAVADLVSVNDLQPAVHALNIDDLKAVSADSFEKIKSLIEKPKVPGEVTLKNMQTIGKALSLMSKIAPSCDNKSKVLVNIVNNLAGVCLELVTQSNSHEHEEACGIFQSAPDAYIGPGSATSILSSARSALFDNCNGVIYKAVFKEKTFYLTIAWSFAFVTLLGKGNRYYLEISEEPGDPTKIVKKVAEKGTQGVIDTSKKGSGSQPAPFKLKGSYSDPHLSIIVEKL